MKPIHQTLLIAVLLTTGTPVAGQDALKLESTQTLPAPSLSPPAVEIRNPYFSAYVDTNHGEDSVEEPATPLERLQLADPWLKLLRTDDASRTGWERDECAPTEQAEPDRLCGLRWRKAGGFAGLTTRLDEVSSRMKSGVFGERLGDVVEVELDSSPEIKFEWKFR